MSGREARFRFSFIGAAILCLSICGSPGGAFGQDATLHGITQPFKLAPYSFTAPGCRPPEDRGRSLVFAQDNNRQFMQGVRNGLQAAARDRKLNFSVALARDDAQAMVDSVEGAIRTKQGAIVAAPIDAIGLAPSLRKAIASGTYVGTVVPPPAVTILNAPQYLTGKVLAEAASAYIDEKLDGKANVVLLTHDSLQFLSPRFTAMRDVLAKSPGVTIVADISPSPVNVEGGYEMMKLILLAHPKIDVVLGADTVVIGALKALREAGLASPRQFLGGIDGEPDAVSEIQNSESPYKVTVSLASPIFGYALGSFAADWLDGTSVPQAMDILPTVLTADNVAEYEQDTEDPATIFLDPDRRDQYLKFYGSICYTTRQTYLDFPWSSDSASAGN